MVAIATAGLGFDLRSGRVLGPNPVIPTPIVRIRRASFSLASDCAVLRRDTRMTFSFYHSNFVRVNLALVLIDEHRRAHLSSIVKTSLPSFQHREWAAAHAERRRLADGAGDTGESA